MLNLLSDFWRFLKGWRTVIYNAVSGFVLGGGLAILMATDWEVLGFSPKTAGWLILSIKILDNIVNMGMRAATKTPIGKRY